MTGAELKRVRAILGYSRRTLAEIIGVSAGTIARWEMPGNKGRWPIPAWVAVTVETWVQLNIMGGQHERGTGIDNRGDSIDGADRI